jgi:biopolymer transport protein ExbD
VADKPQYLDVWIVESNTAYKDVPYTVVADWIQQGRLLENDRVKPAKTTEWLPLDRLFAAYLPKAEPFRAEDRAEALEPVQLDIAWGQPRSEEEQDVDMIPLIDVSLVLLIFFMMTASVTTAASTINTPGASWGTDLTSDARMYWVGIDRGADNQPVYALGQGDGAPAVDDRGLTEVQVLQRLNQKLQEEGARDVRVKADRSLPYSTIKQMTIALERMRARKLIRQVYAEVSEAERP